MVFLLYLGVGYFFFYYTKTMHSYFWNVVLQQICIISRERFMQSCGMTNLSLYLMWCKHQESSLNTLGVLLTGPKTTPTVLPVLLWSCALKMAKSLDAHNPFLFPCWDVQVVRLMHWKGSADCLLTWARAVKTVQATGSSGTLDL